MTLNLMLLRQCCGKRQQIEAVLVIYESSSDGQSSKSDIVSEGVFRQAASPAVAPSGVQNPVHTPYSSISSIHGVSQSQVNEQLRDRRGSHFAHALSGNGHFTGGRSSDMSMHKSLSTSSMHAYGLRS